MVPVRVVIPKKAPSQRLRRAQGMSDTHRDDSLSSFSLGSSEEGLSSDIVGPNSDQLMHVALGELVQAVIGGYSPNMQSRVPYESPCRFNHPISISV